jgi:hypothetical protein
LKIHTKKLNFINYYINSFVYFPLTKTQLFNVSSIADGNLVDLAVDFDGWNPDDMINDVTVNMDSPPYTSRFQA